MKIYDISMLIEPNMMVYKDNPLKKPKFTNTSNHESGCTYETKVELDIHCGTHIDMPLHMIKEGRTMDSFDFRRLITPCKIFDLTNIKNNYISSKDIADFDIEKNDFVIFKTKNSFYNKANGFDYNFVFVDESAARLLKEKNINGVGIDALGIERSQENHMTHKLLLEDGVIILEGLELKDVKEGVYQLIALPVKLKGTEGSWVRAVVIEE